MANKYINTGLKLKQELITPSNPVLNKNKRNSVFNKSQDQNFFNKNNKKNGYIMQDQEYQNFSLIEDDSTKQY